MGLSDGGDGIPFPSRAQRIARAQMEPSRQRVADAVPRGPATLSDRPISRRTAVLDVMSRAGA